MYYRVTLSIAPFGFVKCLLLPGTSGSLKFCQPTKGIFLGSMLQNLVGDRLVHGAP